MKRLREDAQKLREENTKLEHMEKSCDENITEIAKEIGLDRVREDAKAKDEDDDNGGDDACTRCCCRATPCSCAMLALIKH
jgi:hypothetical protein